MVAIPVLVVVPAERSVEESALLAAEAREHRLEAAPAALPAGVTIDNQFAAIALGTGEPAAPSLEMAAAGKGEKFVVRGLMDSEAIETTREATPEGAQIFVDPQIGLYRICPDDPPKGSAADVRGLLQVDTLQERGHSGEGVAIAIVDSGISLAHLRDRGLVPRLDPHISWSPVSTSRPGHHAVHHGTMCAYCALIAAPGAVLLDFPVLLTKRRGGSVMDGILSDALQAYSVLLTTMRTPEAERPYHSLVVNNSWGMFHPSWDFPPGHPGRYGDNPRHPFNIIVGALASAGADILFAAGNCGSECPDNRCQGKSTDTITGANSHSDVLTLAGVDVTGDRVGYSSQGPGVPALDQEKPDIAAYTHFAGSEAFGAGSPDSGTSTACPVAAGCTAALRTNLRPSQLSPADLFETIRTTARQVGAEGWNADYGHGIIDPLAAANRVAPPA